jgi:hypothetical protein
LQQLQQQEALLLTPQAMQQLQQPGLKLSVDQLVSPSASLAWVDGMLLAAATSGQAALVVHCLRVVGDRGCLLQLPSAAQAAQELRQRPMDTEQPSSRLDAWAALVLLGQTPGPARVKGLLSIMEPAAASAAAAAAGGGGGEALTASSDSSALWLQLQQRLQDIQQLARPDAAMSTLDALVAAAAGPGVAIALFRRLQQVQKEAGAAATLTADAGLSIGACNRLLQLVGTAAVSGAMSSADAALVLEALQLAEVLEGDSDAPAAAAAAAAPSNGNTDSTTRPPLATVVQLSVAAQAAAMQAHAALGLDVAMVQLVQGSGGKLLESTVAAWHARVRGVVAPDTGHGVQLYCCTAMKSA